MPAEIRVPVLGESIVEATVGRWLKQIGESVAVGEPVVELETEKVNTEVPADEAGILERMLHAEGETVHPGDVLGTIVTATSDLPPPLGEGRGEAEGPPAVTGAPGDDRSGPAAVVQAPQAVAPSPTLPQREREIEAADELAKVRVSSLAERIADELGVELTRVPGTGPGGRVMKEDVVAYAREMAAAEAPPPHAAERRIETAAPSPALPQRERGIEVPTVEALTPTLSQGERGIKVPAAPQPPAAPRPPSPDTRPPSPDTRPPSPDTRPLSPVAERPETRQRMSRRRLAIARRLVEAQQTAAMLTTFNEVDMSNVIALRQRRREAFRQRHGVGLGYMSFFTKAVVGALKAFPQVNSVLQGEELILKHYYDIGIAIGDPEGLVVPVLRDADRMTFAEIEAAIERFVKKAREHTLTLDDLRGGTFTITNGGVFGSLLSTPILNPPQVGILGMHKIEERPVAVSGQVVVRPMMYLALSYDHRVVDGREAVQFLVKVKELIEDPEALLLEG